MEIQITKTQQQLDFIRDLPKFYIDKQTLIMNNSKQLEEHFTLMKKLKG